MARSMPKLTIPAPSALLGRPMLPPIDARTYADRDELYADLGEAYRAAVAGAPAGMTVTLHLCRGNFRSACGFASTEEGNALTEDEQWAKLERIVRVAEDVWGA